MLVLHHKTGCKITIKPVNSDNINIKILSTKEGAIKLSLSSNSSFKVGDILSRQRYIMLKTGCSLVLETLSKERINVTLIKLDNKIIIGYEANREIQISRTAMRKRIYDN